MEIKRVGTQASAKGPADWFTGTVRIDPLFQANAQHAPALPVSRLSRARAPHGTPIRSVRRSLSHLGLAGRSERVDRLKKFGPVMWFGFRQD